MAKINVTEFIESLKEMTVLELNDLVKAIEEEFGVTAAAPVAVVAGGAEVKEEGPSSYNVVLAEVGPNKINVIKAVREITGLGLAEAKGLVDKAPGNIKENVAEEEANKIKEALEAAGAKVELK